MNEFRVNPGDSGYNAPMVNPEVAAAPLKAAAGMFGSVAKVADAFAGEQAQLLEYKRKTEDDTASRKGLLNLKEGSNEAALALESGRDWRAVYNRTRDKALENGPQFQDEAVKARFELERDETLKDLYGKLELKEHKLTLQRARETFNIDLNSAMEEARATGNFGAAERVVMSGTGKYLSARAASSKLKSLRKDAQDYDFNERMNDPRKALLDLEGEYGQGLDFRTRRAYTAAAHSALSGYQDSNMEKISKAAYLGGEYLSDDELKDYVKEGKLSYKAIASYRELRDKTQERTLAFDAEVFDGLQSEIQYYNTDEDADRTWLAKIKSNISSAAVPKESKEYLYDQLKGRVEKKPDSEVMSMIGGALDKDAEAGLLVEWPRDEYGELLKTESSREALKAYKDGLQLKLSIRKEMERYVRDNPGLAPEVYRAEYERRRDKVVVSKAGGFFNELRKDERPVDMALDVPDMKATGRPIASGGGMKLPMAETEEVVVENDPISYLDAKARGYLFGETAARQMNLKGDSYLSRAAKENEGRDIKGDGAKTVLDYGLEGMRNHLATFQSDTMPDSLYGVSSEEIKGLSEDQAVKLVVCKMGAKANNAPLMRAARQWVRRKLYSL